MNSSSLPKVTAIALVCVAVSACTRYDMTKAERTAAYKEYVESEKLTEHQRVHVFDLDSWTPLGEEHLIVRHRVSDYYLLTLNRRCYDLDFGNAIIWENDDRSLDARFDWISVVGQGGIRCFIKTIHEIDKDQRKALLEIGKKKKSET